MVLIVNQFEISVGDVFFKGLVPEIAECSYFRRRMVVSVSSGGFIRGVNVCSLTSERCQSVGKRCSFSKPDRFGCCLVLWVCPELIGLPDDLEV